MPWPTSTLLRKDCARTGEFFLPDPGTARATSRLAITSDRLTLWINAFRLMQQRGVRVDLTLDHQPDTRARVGRITELYRCTQTSLNPDPKGTHLAFVCEPGHPELLPLILQNPEASIELSTHFRDGLGHHYPEAVTAISLVRHPVIPGQRPFEVFDQAALTWSKPASAQTPPGLQTNPPTDPRSQKLSRRNTPPYPFTARPTRRQPISPQRRTTMDHEQLLPRLADAVGMTPNEADQLDTDQLVEQVRQLHVTHQEINDLKQQLDELLHERDTLAAQLDEAADTGSHAPPPIEADALEDLVDGYRGRLDRLVDEGRISPACSLKLSSILFGQPGERPAICLSRRAASHAGLTSPPARAILDALALNPPFAGPERSGPQLLALSRPNHSTQPNHEPDHTLKQWIEQANQPRPDQAVI